MGGSSGFTVESSGSAGDTGRIAAEYARTLRPGDLVLVSGEIGSGKSTSVRAALRELGVEGPIPSPTFTIGRAYQGRMPASHLDLYRLGEPGSEVPDLLGDYLDPSGVTFVDWPRGSWEGFLEPVGRVGRVEIDRGSGDEREVRLAEPVLPDG